MKTISGLLFRIRQRYISILLCLLIWLILTLAPWQGLLGEQFLIRFLISLAIYVSPGIFISYLIEIRQPPDWLRLFLIGLLISTTITGILGLVARGLQLSFLFIQTGYILVGAILMVAVVIAYHKKVSLPFTTNLWDVLSLLVVVVLAAFTARMALPRPIHDDSYTYNALLYYYQHAEAITFGFPDPLGRLNISRFWIAFWPLVEAMLAGFSKLDGLFITGVYLAPVLAVCALLATFTLGRALGFSRRGAALAVTAQVFSLIRLSEVNLPGFEFFSQLIEDKAVAAFVICPILFLLVVEYLQNPKWKRLLLVSLGAIAVIFIHPVIFGMACLIIGLYGVIALFHRQQRWAYLKLIFLLVLLVLTPYSFRFGNSGFQNSLSFSIHETIQSGQISKLSGRIAYNENSLFYGISPELLKGFPYRLSLAASLVAIFFFMKNKLARFILASFLVLGICTLPYTGWLIGLFTTPPLLWRITWLMPFGLAFALLVQTGEHLLFKKVKIMDKFSCWMMPLIYLGTQAILVAGLFYILPWANLNLAKPDVDLRNYYQQYVDMGDVMNGLNLYHQPVIIGGPDETTNAIIPSLTRKLWPLVFRVEIPGDQRNLWDSLVGDQVDVHERYSRLVQNQVEYLLVRNLAPWMQELLDTYPANFRSLHWNSYLVLFQLTP